MKHGKRLTRKEKVLLTGKHLNPANWLVERRSVTSIVFLHKESNKLRKISF
ncbi:DUF6906 family protein [Enterococcus gallinarum]|uniref:DUF6906 family protein n=1 Tax=Enterococcus gallinarum TaxID=1353 RepID=UPI0018ABB1AA|nr:hypothetical protein [Enterococcus gallinarum]